MAQKRKGTKVTKEDFERFLEEYSKPTYVVNSFKINANMLVPAYKFKMCKKTE